MTRIDDASVEFNFKDNINSKTIFRCTIYSLSINILRVFSGLGGLVFEQ